MAKTAMKIKTAAQTRNSLQENTTVAEFVVVHTCILRKYGICRVCFRELAYKGQIPGVKKAKLGRH